MIRFNMPNGLYGKLIVVGGLNSDRFNDKRRKTIYHLKRSLCPPGEDCSDRFQFGRGSSQVNNYVLFNYKFKLKYLKKHKPSISRFAFELTGNANTGNISINRSALNEFGDRIVPQNEIFIGNKNQKTVWKKLAPHEKCELNNGDIISLPGATLLWQSEFNYCEGLIDKSTDLVRMQQCKDLMPKEMAQFWLSLGLPGHFYEAVCPLCEKNIDYFPEYTAAEETNVDLDYYMMSLLEFQNNIDNFGAAA